MTIINEGLNRVRDLLDGDITKAQAGTDGTSPSQNDSGLFTTIASTKSLTTNTKGANPASISVTHIINQTIAAGENLQEWELRINNDTESLNRTVTAPLSKTSTQQVTRIVTIEITQD